MSENVGVDLHYLTEFTKALGICPKFSSLRFPLQNIQKIKNLPLILTMW